jgi:hypothetical protein
MCFFSWECALSTKFGELKVPSATTFPPRNDSAAPAIAPVPHPLAPPWPNLAARNASKTVGEGEFHRVSFVVNMADMGFTHCDYNPMYVNIYIYVCVCYMYMNIYIMVN